MCETCGCDEAPASASPYANPYPGPRPRARAHVGAASHLGLHPLAGLHPQAGHQPGTGPHPHLHDGAAAGAARTVVLQQKVLARNDSLAQANRAWLAERGVLAVNLMGSPGAGKTTLLERTVRELASGIPVCVIEGDQETVLDADRIEAAGAAVVQINTGAGCHLDAGAVAQALSALDPAPGSAVFIENVGNLVCPALFDLGEQARVVIASPTEGADKPRKYPQMFAAADLVLLNKTDLLRHLDFDAGQFAADLASVSPQALLLRVSAATGEGVGSWYTWLRQHAGARRHQTRG